MTIWIVESWNPSVAAVKNDGWHSFSRHHFRFAARWKARRLLYGGYPVRVRKDSI